LNPFSSRVHRSIEPIHQSCSISESAVQSNIVWFSRLTESAVSRFVPLLFIFWYQALYLLANFVCDACFYQRFWFVGYRMEPSTHYPM
jgi:hypothetical protein